MSDKVVIYHNMQGGMSILIPAENVYVRDKALPPSREDFVCFDHDERDSKTHENLTNGYRKATIEEIADRDARPFLAELEIWHVVNRTDIPQDRYFRSAWMHEGGIPFVHMDKAREIHRNNLRDLRAPIMALLDTDYIRADEVGDAVKKNSIVQRKQELRDITTHTDIESAKTPGELKMAAMDVIEDKINV